MPIFTETPPLSLYIHIPWCVRKCPYCDFNSHEAKQAVPEDAYVTALLDELDNHATLIDNRPIVSIFFGGGTPSLFSATAIGAILDGVAKRLHLPSQIEITLEANPGTIDQERFNGLRQVGINRLSLGIQSLQDAKLKTLGRIHNRDHALHAIEIAKQAGFDNFNLDLMYGLPNQSAEDAMDDLKTALSYHPNHLSWYQLTIEPNTLFYHQRPTLPADDTIWEMVQNGFDLLKNAGLTQYEVSAFARPLRECAHNRNYWEFGDYLGIGAGAHSKITDKRTHSVFRFAQIKHPRDYLDASKRKALRFHEVSESGLIFEFMLNALRLTQGFAKNLFSERTGLSLQHMQKKMDEAAARGLLIDDTAFIKPTELGKRFLNDLTAIFLPA